MNPYYYTITNGCLIEVHEDNDTEATMQPDGTVSVSKYRPYSVSNPSPKHCEEAESRLRERAKSCRFGPWAEPTPEGWTWGYYPNELRKGYCGVMAFEEGVIVEVYDYDFYSAVLPWEILDFMRNLELK